MLPATTILASINIDKRPARAIRPCAFPVLYILRSTSPFVLDIVLYLFVLTRERESYPIGFNLRNNCFAPRLEQLRCLLTFIHNSKKIIRHTERDHKHQSLPVRAIDHSQKVIARRSSSLHSPTLQARHSSSPTAHIEAAAIQIT